MNSTPPQTEIFVENKFQLPFEFSALQAFIIILLAELGDKTFIMLIILQMKTNQITILTSALLAEIFMNCIAVFLGFGIDRMLYQNLLDYIGLMIFFFYGLFLIGDSFQDSPESFEAQILEAENPNEDNEKDNKNLQVIPESNENELTTPLIEKEDYKNENLISFGPGDTLGVKETINDNEEKRKNENEIDFKIFWTIFSSMCISECGDRTQFTAMIMSGIYEMWGVLLGSCLALTCSVFLGVFLGKKLIKYLHENVLNFILGIIFLGYSIQLYLGKTVF
jgi:putative Ca2+/H+ antiporter (TMEM165/GDT1 family)